MFNTEVWLQSDCFCLVPVNEASRALAQLHAFSIDTHTQPHLHYLALKLHLLWPVSDMPCSPGLFEIRWRPQMLFFSPLKIYSLHSFNTRPEITRNSDVTLQDIWPCMRFSFALISEGISGFLSLQEARCPFFRCPLLLSLHTWEEYERVLHSVCY